MNINIKGLPEDFTVGQLQQIENCIRKTVGDTPLKKGGGVGATLFIESSNLRKPQFSSPTSYAQDLIDNLEERK